MKRIVSIAFALVLVLSIVMPAAAMAEPAGGAVRAAGADLPVMKLPAALSGASSTPADTGDGSAPAGSEKQTAANKLAVVIGISDYMDYMGIDGDLFNPDKDAREMARALKENYGFSAENIKLLLNKEATAAAIFSALDWLVQNEDADSTVVFFYSGHGFHVADSENYDGDKETDGLDEGIVSHDLYGITDGILAQRLSALESEKVSLSFAQCYSGGMFDDNDDLQGKGRVVAASCRVNEDGWDYLTLGNTLWGKYFVDEGLLKGLADPDGEVSIEEAQAYAYAKVTGVRTDSHPEIYDDYRGDLIL